MAKVMLFNASTLAMEEVDDNDTQAINRFAESGFRRISRHELIALYNPSTGDHKMVLRTQAPAWLAQGYYAEPTYVFHPEQGRKVISAEEAEVLLADGWYDNPAKFSKGDKEAIVEKAVKAMKDEQKEGGKKAAAAA